MRSVNDDDDLLRLYGISDPHELNPEQRRNAHTPSSALRLPIGFTPTGEPAVLDLGYFSSTDDHVLIVSGGPDAGTTTLLRNIVFGIALNAHPQHAGALIVPGKNYTKYSDFKGLPNVGVAESHDQHDIDRLAQWLAGEIDIRRTTFAAAGAENFSEYLQQQPSLPSDSTPLPHYFLIIDNIDPLLAYSDFHQVSQTIATTGYELGMRMIVGASLSAWKTMQQNGYRDCFTARIALGLNANESTDLFDFDIHDDLGPIGDAHIHTTQHGLMRCRLAKSL